MICGDRLEAVRADAMNPGFPKLGAFDFVVEGGPGQGCAGLAIEQGRASRAESRVELLD